MSQTVESSVNSPILLSDPSGIGKSYLAHHLEANFTCARVVPTTTRNPRIGEVDGADYYFLTQPEYSARLSEGRMFMSNQFFQASYGFESSSVDRIIQAGLSPVSEIYTPKITQFLHAYPLARAIFLMPDTEMLLRFRMKARGDSDAQITARIVEGRDELKLYHRHLKQYYNTEYVIISNNLNECVLDIKERFGLIQR